MGPSAPSHPSPSMHAVPSPGDGHFQAAACTPPTTRPGLEPCSPHTPEIGCHSVGWEGLLGRHPWGRDRLLRVLQSDYEVMLATSGARCGSRSSWTTAPALPSRWPGAAPESRGSVGKPRQSCQLTAVSREPGDSSEDPTRRSASTSPPHNLCPSGLCGPVTRC